MKLVQFHPSYAYEDFFEGYRPDKTDDGQVSFKLVAGPLRRLAEEAAKAENAHKPYFLIIDEMNRANLAKVFGELYFLLEYRDDRIYLQYSPQRALQPAGQPLHHRHHEHCGPLHRHDGCRHPPSFRVYRAAPPRKSRSAAPCVASSKPAGWTPSTRTCWTRSMTRSTIGTGT